MKIRITTGGRGNQDCTVYIQVAKETPGNPNGHIHKQKQLRIRLLAESARGYWGLKAQAARVCVCVCVWNRSDHLLITAAQLLTQRHMLSMSCSLSLWSAWQRYSQKSSVTHTLIQHCLRCLDWSIAVINADSVQQLLTHTGDRGLMKLDQPCRCSSHMYDIIQDISYAHQAVLVNLVFLTFAKC